MNNSTSKNVLDYSLLGFTLQFEKDFDILSDSFKRNIRNIFNIIVNCGFTPIEINPNTLYLDRQDSLKIFIEPERTFNKEVTLVKRAWEVIYIIYQQIPEIIYVEPRIDFITQNDGTIGLCCWRGFCIPCLKNDVQNNESDRDERIINDPEWHLKDMQVITAWEKYFENKPENAGKGIVIGHPDTGYLRHPEVPYSETKILELNIPARQRIPNEPPLDKPPASELKPSDLEAASPAVWHGTATASVMVSPRKAPDSAGGKSFVSGVAPGAELLPLRLDAPDYDFRLYSVNLANAINYAASDDPDRFGRPRVDILSISLQGYPSWNIRRAIVNANKKGIIVVASAGNNIPFVGWPAAYDNVIAVASSTIDRKLADHSAFGSRVNIAAPGEGIHCAIILKNGTYAVIPRSGTSYAAPLVAGVAALWLSRHRQEINEKYVDDLGKIPLAFAKLIRETCDPWGWGEINCGPGIINADKLLAASLPKIDDPDLLIPRTIQYDENVSLDQGGLVTFKHLFGSTLAHPDVIHRISSRKLEDADFSKEVGSLSLMEWVLGKLIGRSGGSLTSFLNHFGRELSFHFGTTPELYESLVDALHAEKIEDSLPTVRNKLYEVVSEDLCIQLRKCSQNN